MEEIIEAKLANALFKDAQASGAARFVVDVTGGGVTTLVLEGMKKAMGGLWVGGKASLTAHSVRFSPNALNIAAHEGLYEMVIPLVEVTDVVVRFGFGTKIIDIRTDHGTLSIRCWGAKSFADRINAQRKSLIGAV